jgi:transcriptional regulator with XRE-family HTH domain
MNTKSNKIVINPAFEDLFSFKNEEEKIEHDASMISFRILSEIEKLCDNRKIKKKDLAEMVGTSKSYITQLFNGTKSINTQIMAKLENALDITFETRLKLNEETHSTFFIRKNLSADNSTLYYHQQDSHTKDIISNLETENAQKQIA